MRTNSEVKSRSIIENYDHVLKNDDRIEWIELYLRKNKLYLEDEQRKVYAKNHLTINGNKTKLLKEKNENC